MQQYPDHDNTVIESVHTAAVIIVFWYWDDIWMVNMRPWGPFWGRKTQKTGEKPNDPFCPPKSIVRGGEEIIPTRNLQADETAQWWSLVSDWPDVTSDPPDHLAASLHFVTQPDSGICCHKTVYEMSGTINSSDLIKNETLDVMKLSSRERSCKGGEEHVIRWRKAWSGTEFLLGLKIHWKYFHIVMVMDRMSAEL